MSLNLFVFHHYICGYYDVQTTSADESYRHVTCHLSTFQCFANCFCSQIYIFCSYRKQQNGHLNGITFETCAGHSQIAFQNPSWSQMCWVISATEKLKTFNMHLSTLKCLLHCLLIYICTHVNKGKNKYITTVFTICDYFARLTAFRIKTKFQGRRFKIENTIKGHTISTN